MLPASAGRTRRRHPSRRRSTVRSRSRWPSPHRIRTALARRIHAASHLTGTFTLRSGVVEQRVLRQVPLRVRPRAAPRHRRGAARRSCRPASTRWPGSSSAACRSPRCMSQVTRTAGALRPQGGEDLRHLPARRGRRARRAAAVHRRRRRHLGRRDARRRRRAPRARRGARTGRLRHRSRVGRRREARGRGPRAARAVHDDASSTSRADRGFAGVDPHVRSSFVRRSISAAVGSARASRAARRRTSSRPSAWITQPACLRRAEPGLHQVVAQRDRRCIHRLAHPEAAAPPMSTISPTARARGPSRRASTYARGAS